jgi:hypothetical protein
VNQSAMAGGTGPTSPTVYREQSGVGTVAAEATGPGEVNSFDEDVPF